MLEPTTGEESVTDEAPAGLNRQGRSPKDVEAMLRTEAPGLLAYFLRRVEPKEDASDLLSETLLVVWRRADRLPADAEAARMWMYGAARKVLSGHRRGHSRRLALSARLREELAVADGAPALDERVDALKASMALLAPADRELLGLVHWEGFSLREAAELMGMRAGTARMRYSRLRARLRDAIEEQDRKLRRPGHQAQ